MACVRNVFRMLFIACLHWRGRELSCHCARRPHEYERTRPAVVVPRARGRAYRKCASLAN
eukprot:scaffold111146_cov33-Tisochrysis_lutea.AAC.1